MAHHKKSWREQLLMLTYADSIYDNRLFLLKDGRKRGLWIFLEEDPTLRIKADARFFDQGFDAFMKDLDTFDKKDTMYRFKIFTSLKIHFDPFFGHRTEGSAIRMTWKKVLKLAAALRKGYKDEKKKTDVEDD
jgi:hypothetical protein